MRIDLACRALRNGRRLDLYYGGFRRVVEVHAVGTTTAGHVSMIVWQVRGGSGSDEPVGWKLLRLDDVTEAVEIDERSEAPRRGYRRRARPFVSMRCEV